MSGGVFDLVFYSLLLALLFGLCVQVNGGFDLPKIGRRREWGGIAFEVRKFIFLGFCLALLWLFMRFGWYLLLGVLQSLIKLGLLELPRGGELRNTYTW